MHLGDEVLLALGLAVPVGRQVCLCSVQELLQATTVRFLCLQSNLLPPAQRVSFKCLHRLSSIHQQSDEMPPTCWLEVIVTSASACWNANISAALEGCEQALRSTE